MLAEGFRCKSARRAGRWRLALVPVLVAVLSVSCGGDSSTSAIPTSAPGTTATAATVSAPEGLVLDGAGNLYVSEFEGNRVVKLTPDGLLAEVPLDDLSAPAGLAFDSDSNLVIADHHNNRILRIDPSGVVTTLVGSSAGLNDPIGIAFDPDGNLIIADEQNARLLRVDGGGGVVTLAGDGQAEVLDGGPAARTKLSHPSYVLVDPAGDIVFSDFMLERVLRIDSSGRIMAVAGTGNGGFSGDGGQATRAGLDFPTGLAFDRDGGLLISDANNNRVRRVDRHGVITTVAGTGSAGFAGDGGAATRAQLNAPAGLAVDADGNFYIADQGNDVVRKVDTSGLITTIAGSHP